MAAAPDLFCSRRTRCRQREKFATVLVYIIIALIYATEKRIFFGRNHLAPKKRGLLPALLAVSGL